MKIVAASLCFLICGSIVTANDKVVTADEGRLSIALPSGWKDSEQDQGGTDSVAGYESSDRRTSFYILKMELQTQADAILNALDSTIQNFDADENWIVNQIGEFKSTEINGRPAIYSRIELDLVSGERKIPFVFYLTMVGGRDNFYMLQGSTMMPVRTVREQEVFRMIKSFKIIEG